MTPETTDVDLARYFSGQYPTADKSPILYLPIAENGISLNDRYSIVFAGERGGLNYNPLGLVACLRDHLFVADDNDLYRFHDGYYCRIPQAAVERMILGLVADCGMAIGHTKVHDTYELALATLDYRRIHKEIRDAIPTDNPTWLGIVEDYSLDDPSRILAWDNGWMGPTWWKNHRLLDPAPAVFCTRKIHCDFIHVLDMTDEIRQDADYHLLKLLQQDTLETFYWMLGYILFQREMFPPYIFHLYGPGRTGKSLICDMIADIVGEDQVSRLSILALSRQFGADGLVGKWVNIATETETSQASYYTPIDTEILKKLAGGEIIHADRKYSVGGVTFRNTAKLIFASNSPFILGDPSSGMNRRIITIPFRIRQDDESDIRECLMDKLVQSKIVSRAFEVWMSSPGNAIPIASSESIEAEVKIRTEFDSWSAFMTFYTDSDNYDGRRMFIETMHPRVSDLYAEYVNYCTAEKYQHPLGKKKFNERTRIELGLAMYRAHDGYTWIPDARI